MKKHAGLLGLGFFFMLLQNYSFMRVPSYIQRILDEIGGMNRIGVIKINIVYTLVFTVILTTSMYLMRKLMIDVSRKIEYELRERIYTKLLSVEYFFFQKNQTGDLISRSTNDLNHVRTLLGPGVMYIPNSISRVLFFLPVLIALNASMMGVMGIIIVVLTLFSLIMMPKMRPLFKNIQTAMGIMNNRVWQIISGISTIKRYTAESVEIERFRTLNEDYIKTQMDVVKLQASLRPFLFFLFSLTELVILYFGGRQVIEGRMSMGQLLQFNLMIAELGFPVLSLAWIMTLIQQGIASMERINYILNWPAEATDSKIPLQSSNPEILINKLNYTYPGAESPTLLDISMTIPSGQIVGITGPVGSGKSTLLSIITGLIQPEPGQVFIAGNDITRIESRSLNRHMAVVSQSPFLFSRTVAENIALGETEIPLETIQKAADDAGLTIDLESFPDGLNQQIGERGITLSGGQKQRVAIARALGKSSPMLILDDPLSNVDAQTEARILENLKNLQCFKTLMIVSHRVSVLRGADIIYVLDKGAICEQGTHWELVERGGLYSHLAQMQQMEIELEAV